MFILLAVNVSAKSEHRAEKEQKHIRLQFNSWIICIDVCQLCRELYLYATNSISIVIQCTTANLVHHYTARIDNIEVIHTTKLVGVSIGMGVPFKKSMSCTGFWKDIVHLWLVLFPQQNPDLHTHKDTYVLHPLKASYYVWLYVYTTVSSYGVGWKMHINIICVCQCQHQLRLWVEC